MKFVKHATTTAGINSNNSNLIIYKAQISISIYSNAPEQNNIYVSNVLKNKIEKLIGKSKKG